MVRLVKRSPIVPIASLLLLAVLLVACRVVEKPVQVDDRAPVTRQVAAQSTRPPATQKPAQATAVPATAGRTLPAAAPSSTPAPTRGDIAFRLTILYTGEVHGEVRPCG